MVKCFILFMTESLLTVLYLSTFIFSRTERKGKAIKSGFRKKMKMTQNFKTSYEKSEKKKSEGRVAKMNLADDRVEELSDCSSLRPNLDYHRLYRMSSPTICAF